MKTTYSMWNLFRNCRRAVNWRYIRELVPVEQDKTLTFGTLIHRCLEIWHNTRLIQPVLDHINASCDTSTTRSQWHLATAMMSGYAKCYPHDDFDIIALEKEFEGVIVNPATSAVSRSFTLAGKIDGIVRSHTDGKYYLLEHKTASNIDGSYLERLWTDFQITIYSHYIEQTMGMHIEGVVYNILVKAKLQQSSGESEQAFESRREELISKSKSGRTSAQRKMPETDEEFQKRLAEKYAEPGMFHRESIQISRHRLEELRGELWELTQAFLDARRRDVWYQNTSYCFNYGKPCQYFALCRSDDNQMLIDNCYERKAPNEELSGSGNARSGVEFQIDLNEREAG